MKIKYAALVGILALVGAVYFGARMITPFQTAPQASVADSIDGDTDESAPNVQAYQAAAVSLAESSPQHKYQVSSSTPQFVIFSFDGSKSVDMLNETLAFTHKMAAEGKPLHFTYFINAAYFLTKQNADLYQAPEEPAGVSKIGFSSTTPDIALRTKAFNTAFSEGNEVGSHSAGHFDGSSWSYDEWKQEFASFATLMLRVRQNNPSQDVDAPIFLSSIHGFRAPNLGVNGNLYQLLGNLGFNYDSSGVGVADSWPHKDDYGVWHIPLGTIHLGTNPNPIIAMDYNLWTRQSGAQELAVKGTPLWQQYYDEIEKAYMDYFNKDYNGNRGPIVIGDHFSKWNDGVYWEAMKAFAENVCGQPQVRCTTFRDLVDYLDTSGVPAIVR